MLFQTARQKLNPAYESSPIATLSWIPGRQDAQGLTLENSGRSKQVTILGTEVVMLYEFLRHHADDLGIRLDAPK